MDTGSARGNELLQNRMRRKESEKPLEESMAGRGPGRDGFAKWSVERGKYFRLQGTGAGFLVSEEGGGGGGRIWGQDTKTLFSWLGESIQGSSQAIRGNLKAKGGVGGVF